MPADRSGWQQGGADVATEPVNSRVYRRGVGPAMGQSAGLKRQSGRCVLGSAWSSRSAKKGSWESKNGPKSKKPKKEVECASGLSGVCISSYFYYSIQASVLGGITEGQQALAASRPARAEWHPAVGACTHAGAGCRCRQSCRAPQFRPGSSPEYRRPCTSPRPGRG